MDFTQEPGYAEFIKLRKQGIVGTEPVKFEHVSYPALGVRVETAIGDQQEVKPLNWNVEVISREGAVVVCSDWEVTRNESGQRVIRFAAHMRLPAALAGRNFQMCGQYAMSFADFNFCHGHEAFPEAYNPNVATKPDAWLEFQDIGWLLPCRFADRLGEALAKLNAFVMSGTLEDSIIYGTTKRN